MTKQSERKALGGAVPVATLGQGDGPQAQSPRRGRKDDASQDGKPVQLDLFCDASFDPAIRRALWSVRNNMLSRCYNPNVPQFKDYGGRGIFVCDEWRASASVFVRWAIEAGYQPGLQLDRRDNDGPYSPDNCRFVTRLQNANNKRNNVRLSDGTTVPEVARQLGVKRDTLHMRIHRGMSPDEAAARPVLLPGQHARGRFAPDGRALVELARDHGLAPATLYARLDRGWPLERALSAPLFKGHVLSDGTRRVDAARAAGLNEATVSSRVKRGLSPDEAIALGVTRSGGPVRMFLSDGTPLVDAIRVSGLSGNTVRGRIHAGWSPDEAVSIPKGGKRPAATAQAVQGESVASALDGGKQAAGIAPRPQRRQNGAGRAQPAFAGPEVRRTGKGALAPAAAFDGGMKQLQTKVRKAK